MQRTFVIVYSFLGIEIRFWMKLHETEQKMALISMLSTGNSNDSIWLKLDTLTERKFVWKGSPIGKEKKKIQFSKSPYRDGKVMVLASKGCILEIR